MTNGIHIEANHRLLIIDDNRAIHDDIRKILLDDSERSADLLSDENFLFDEEVPTFAAAKFEIESAYQGQEGLAKVESRSANGGSYALAFVDVRMPPGWDGVETIQRLWKVDPNLQVVICTAFSDYSWKDIRNKLGHSDNLLVLKKPFDSIEVVQIAYALTRKWLVSRQAQVRLDDLDAMVEARTAELQAANATLKKAFEERAKIEDAFRIVFEASPIGIALLDRELRFVSANQALERIQRTVREDIIGNDPVELEWFASQEALREAVSAAHLDQGLDHYEIRLSHRNLPERTGLLWARCVSIRDVQHVLCFVLDISERVAMERELLRARIAAEAAAKAKSDFLANMSHEIRTPLNGVLGLSTFLEDASLPDPVREIGKLIRTSGEILRRVLDDVLDFSKIESGKLEIEREPFSLRDALEWSKAIYQKGALDKRLQLVMEVDPAVPDRLIGDTTRLRQVLANLISNAVKFTADGTIKISVQGRMVSSGPSVFELQVHVSDTGIGIPEDRMDRLFQSFSQVDASTNRRFGGTGLGLALCKRLVEMMGGAITVTSHVGAGTTFSFTVQTGVAEPDGLASTQFDASQPACRVLVVEDNPINCVVIQRMLEKLGHNVVIVRDGNAAIRCIQETTWDLVLMDVNMPGLDGLQATRQIRSLGGTSATVPILALTASALVNDREECLSAGMNDHLSKPVSMDALRAVIDRWTSVAANRERLVPALAGRE
jgi:PAS domain S-box-containing protein